MSTQCQIADLVKAGLIQTGQKAVLIFKQARFEGEVTDVDGGSLAFEVKMRRQHFSTPGAAAVACVRTVRPNQAFVNGWKVC